MLVGLGVLVWPSAYALAIFAPVGNQVFSEMSPFDLELAKSIMLERWTTFFPLTTLSAWLTPHAYLATWIWLTPCSL